MDKPHCEHFKPSPTASWICKWWESGYIGIGEAGEIVYFCSLPTWGARTCETRGLRLMPRADQEEDSFE